MTLNRGNSLFKLIIANKNLPNFSSTSSGRSALICSTIKNYYSSNVDELKTLDPAKYQKVNFMTLKNL